MLSHYTLIFHTRVVIEAMEHFLLQRDPNELPSSACIVTLAEIVLTHNYFMFLNDFFIQTKGTAMGSNMAPNYAICMWVTWRNSLFSILSKMFSCLTSLFGNGILMIFLFYVWVMQNRSRHSRTPVLIIWDLLCNLIHLKSVFLIFWSCVKIMFYTLIFTGSLLIVTVCWELIVVTHFPWKIVCPTANSVESKEFAKNN